MTQHFAASAGGEAMPSVIVPRSSLLHHIATVCTRAYDSRRYLVCSFFIALFCYIVECRMSPPLIFPPCAKGLASFAFIFVLVLAPFFLLPRNVERG